MGSVGSKMVDGGDFAQQLYNSQGNKKELTSLRKQLMHELRYYKETGEVRDPDLTYHIIYKDGEFKSFNAFESDADIRSIKTTDIAYISLQSGDGINDSLGFNTDPFPIQAGQESLVKISRSIADNPEQYENYTDEVERIFKTSWGKRHPRNKK